MDIHARIGSIATKSYWFRLRKLDSCTSSSGSPLSKTFCSRRDSQEPKQNGDNGKGAVVAMLSDPPLFPTSYHSWPFLNHGPTGDKISTDWDKAWSNFKQQGKKSMFSQFSPNKYVSWNPRQSNYPLSEEVDPIKRAERSNLMLWTSPRFTLAGAIVIVTLLLVYTILAVVK